MLAGHDKAVSYVKFVDSATLVTASTDNTLKLWDLKKTTHNGLSTNACSLTFGGHTNEKVCSEYWNTICLFSTSYKDYVISSHLWLVLPCYPTELRGVVRF